MDELRKELCANQQIPDRVGIYAVRQRSPEEQARRLKQLLTIVGEARECKDERGDWLHQEDRTMVRLPRGGRAEVFHASGAMRVISGLPPMEQLFDKEQSREQLEKLVAKVADRIGVKNWIAAHESLAFERLWQIKAAAADRKGKSIKPVLCRAVGTFRQSVGGLPIVGGASIAIKVAAKGAIDMVATQFLETESKPLDAVAVLKPEEAARDIERQLRSLMGGEDLTCEVRAQPLMLGYLHLGRRKAQHLVAPHYVATVRIEGEEVQAYQLVTPATELLYQPLCLSGQAARGANYRRAA